MQDLFGPQGGRDLHGHIGRRSLDDLQFLLLARVFHERVEHEAVQLGFRERIGPFLFDGVLSGHHKKRLFQHVPFASHRHLMFLHGL